MVYLVCYDLDQPGQNYETVHKAIKSYVDYCHAMESGWFISTTKNPAEIKRYILSVMDTSDLLFVSQITNCAGQHKPDTVKWLNSHGIQ